MAVETIYIIKRSLVLFITTFQFLLLVRALLSWIPSNDTVAKISDIINTITDPVVNMTYKITNYKLVQGNVDFTIIFLYFMLNIVRSFIVKLLF